MARPSEDPLIIATDALYSTGIYAGRPNKIVPVSGIQTEGFLPSELLSPQNVNHMVNNHGEWIEYLKDGYDADQVDFSNITSRVDTLESNLRLGQARYTIDTATYSDDDYLSFTSNATSAPPRTVVTTASNTGGAGGQHFLIGNGSTAQIGWWQININQVLTLTAGTFVTLSMKVGVTTDPAASGEVARWISGTAGSLTKVQLNGTYLLGVSSTTIPRVSFQVAASGTDYVVSDAAPTRIVSFSQITSGI